MVTTNLRDRANQIYDHVTGIVGEIPPRKTVGVAMIVKNESAMLAKCLDSVKEADAIYISDTGSSDNTVEIARQYTDHVYTEFMWQDDFAAARNFIKEKLPTDWLLSMDADEQLLVPFSNVRQAMELAKDAVSCKLIAADNKQSNYFPRLFRNGKDIQWYGAVHNYPSVLGEDVGDVRICYDYSPAHLQDPNRALRILEKECQSQDKVRERFYLGREYFYRGYWEKCVRILGEYVQQSRFLAEKAEAFMVMSRAYWYGLKDAQSARDACLQALVINPNFREACLWMAVLAGEGSGNPRWQKNADQWKRLASTASNDDVLFVRPI